MLHKIIGNIKFNRLYTCNKCGKKEPGNTEYAQIEAYTKVDITDFIRPQSAQYMPVGWCSYPYGYFCMKCH